MYRTIKAVLVSAFLSTATYANEPLVPVTIDNFARVATEREFATYIGTAGGMNEFFHLRRPITAEEQATIRFNRDTLLSVAVIDISQGATLTMPDPEGRYMSTMVINQDHYINKVFHGGGSFPLDPTTFHTDYVIIAVRTLVDASDPKDVATVNALQDRMMLEATSAKPFVLPNYDMEAFDDILAATLQLGTYAPQSFRTFGSKDAVDPVRHFVGSGTGWGGLPEHEAYYVTVTEPLPNAELRVEVPSDVPVGAFWSFTVYDDVGYLLKDAGGRHKVSSVDSEKNEDGSVTIHLGGCEDGRKNCLPITDNWTYVARMYQPREDILNGEWTFPEPRLIK